MNTSDRLLLQTCKQLYQYIQVYVPTFISSLAYYCLFIYLFLNLLLFSHYNSIIDKVSSDSVHLRALDVVFQEYSLELEPVPVCHLVSKTSVLPPLKDLIFLRSVLMRCFLFTLANRIFM